MDTAIKLVLVAVVVVWLALIVWTFMDARRRIADRFLVGCATLGALFPFIGSLIYLIVRPPELLADVHERELEVAAAEARLAQAKAATCPHCDTPTQPDFLRCPGCLRKLREACPSCSRPLDQGWRICPYCEADPLKPAATRSSAPTRRRRTSASAKTGETDSVTKADSPKAAAKTPAKATTKAAAKRSTRRAPAPASASDAGAAESAPAKRPARSQPSADTDASPETDPTA